ncbi:MAG: extracellular solute-binding protein [Clostridia bacterium]|nr:extracellular solute-binding protein [Clostridia bacterium]
MREKKFLRIAAFLLCLTMLLGNAVVFASASDAEGSGGSITDVSLEELRELLNAISYEEYSDKNAAVPGATQTVEVQIDAYVTEDEGFKIETKDGINALFTPATGEVSWTVNVPETAKYAIKIEYYPDQNRSTSIERILKVNDKVPFAEARFLTLPKRWVNDYVDAVITPGKGETAESIATEAKSVGYTDVRQEDGKVLISFPDFVTQEMSEFADAFGVRFLQRDITNNEIRPTTSDVPKWMTYYLKDSSGYYTTNFEFALNAGENKITLEGQNEPMSIKSITLYPVEKLATYEEYKAKYANEPVGQDTIKIEAELANVMSNKTIYPVEDRSCAINSPTDTTCSVLNTIGGDKWATAGQWVEYRFKVSSSGRYDIVSRFRQDVLDGMSTCRSMYIFSEGLDENAKGYYNGAPFEEALKLSYDYSAEWQVTELAAGKQDSNGDGKINDDDTMETYEVYLEKDVIYTIRLEVTLGKMGDVVRRVEDILNAINNDYLNIIKLTGITPDSYRDYGFSQVMPDTMVDMVIQSQNLYDLADELTLIAGEKSSNVATLEKVARLLKEMGTDDDEVAKNLSNLKSYIGTLGTFLSDAQTQPLQLDFIQIQPATDDPDDLPKATPNFFQSFLHEVKGFWQSFWRDYNSMGALVETDETATEVWLATARDQSQVYRNLINNDFTPNTNIAIDLKLVAGGTLLPSILAGSGPDVYLGLGQGDVINYAIRSALLNIEGFEDFDEFTTNNFNEAAMIVLGIEDADEQMHYYGLPESQGFPMMFVRIDILADLGLEVPKTWDDLMACIPTLQANNMQIGLPTDYKIFLYQQGGDLFADDGMRINLDSKLGLASFEKMCNLFTMYSFPYQYDAANRFRTGEMPILLGDYTGLYNQLKVFATEINGKWEFMPLPGEINGYDENGDPIINNVSISGVAATVMVKGCDKVESSWEFMKWYTGENCQVDFSNEMVAIMGPSAKQAVSNKNALASLPWTTAEYEQVQNQFNNLGSVPNYPGAYIIDRYTNFAFLSAYNDKANPSDALLAYIYTINKEIERKRNEFNLETLSDGVNEYKDLLTKRLAQINELVGYIREDDEFKAEYEALMVQIERASRSDDAAELANTAEAVKQLYDQLDPDGSKFIADRNEVMGYDMTDTTLTKAEKKKIRNCFSYEVYKNTESLVSQLKCMVGFLEDAARLTGV